MANESIKRYLREILGESDFDYGYPKGISTLEGYNYRSKSFEESIQKECLTGGIFTEVVSNLEKSGEINNLTKESVKKELVKTLNKLPIKWDMIFDIIYKHSPQRFIGKLINLPSHEFVYLTMIDDLVRELNTPLSHQEVVIIIEDVKAIYGNIDNGFDLSSLNSLLIKYIYDTFAEYVPQNKTTLDKGEVNLLAKVIIKGITFDSEDIFISKYLNGNEPLTNYINVTKGNFRNAIINYSDYERDNSRVTLDDLSQLAFELRKPLSKVITENFSNDLRSEKAKHVQFYTPVYEILGRFLDVRNQGVFGALNYIKQELLDGRSLNSVVITGEIIDVYDEVFRDMFLKYLSNADNSYNPNDSNLRCSEHIKNTIGIDPVQFEAFKIGEHRYNILGDSEGNNTFEFMIPVYKSRAKKIVKQSNKKEVIYDSQTYLRMTRIATMITTPTNTQLLKDNDFIHMSLVKNHQLQIKVKGTKGQMIDIVFTPSYFLAKIKQEVFFVVESAKLEQRHTFSVNGLKQVLTHFTKDNPILNNRQLQLIHELIYRGYNLQYSNLILK